MDIPIPICFFCKSCVESFLYPIDKVRDLIQALKVGGYCHFLGTAKIKEVEFRRVIIYAAFYYDSSSQNKKKKKERKKENPKTFHAAARVHSETSILYLLAAAFKISKIG